ncbi:ABC-three component system middle component 2 [Serratia fonticola]|uniref:ABC-three component system middle component 2 n=1 Tax=Serratia fonticola TaxID=47917 RepID=UPI003AF3A54E
MEDLKVRLYNSRVEISLRLAKILMVFNPTGLTIEKLICIDFLVLNLGDFIPEQNSLHPAIPRRDSQLAITRKTFTDALILMKNYRIVGENYTRHGILFTVTDKTFSFTNAVQNEYLMKMDHNIHIAGRDADLVVVVDCQIRTDDLIVHLF